MLLRLTDHYCGISAVSLVSGGCHFLLPFLWLLSAVKRPLFFLFSLHITQCLTVPCPPTTVSCQSTRPAKGMNYLTALRADINTAINAAAVAAALSVAFTVNWQALRPFSATVSLHRAILRSHSHMFNSGSSSSVLLSQTAAINYRWPFNCIYSRGEKSPVWLTRSVLWFGCLCSALWREKRNCVIQVTKQINRDELARQGGWLISTN